MPSHPGELGNPTGGKQVRARFVRTEPVALARTQLACPEPRPAARRRCASVAHNNVTGARSVPSLLVLALSLSFRGFSILRNFIGVWWEKKQNPLAATDTSVLVAVHSDRAPLVTPATCRARASAWSQWP